MGQGNPFKGAGKKNREPQGGAMVSEEATNLCPLVGTFPVLMGPPPGAIERPGQEMPGVQHVLMPCVEHRCALWNAKEGGCSQKLANDALVEIKEPLIALAGIFAKKS